MVSAANGSTVAAYSYDPFGRRVAKTVNGVTTQYVYDGTDIAASTTNGVATHFIHGPGTDEHLAMVQGGVPFFYHSDGLGSITRITDSGQNIIQSYSYTSFGAPTATTGFQQPYQFTGREFDTETNLHYYRSRTYDSSTGRFLSRDSIGFAGGDAVLTNYVGGNPVNFTDPSGNYWWVPVIGGAAGGGANAWANYDAYNSGKLSTGQYWGSIGYGALFGAASSVMASLIPLLL